MDDDYEIREARVTYTTKELLERIDGRLERLEEGMTGMVTHAEFSRLESRVGAVELRMDERLGTVEDKMMVVDAINANKAALFSRREKIIGVVLALATIGLQSANILWIQ